MKRLDMRFPHLSYSRTITNGSCLHADADGGDSGGRRSRVCASISDAANVGKPKIGFFR
jgi:hypothetical protein